MGLTVAVTGASGFLGRHLCHALREAGHAVVGTSRRDLRLAGVEVRRADLADPASLERAFADCEVVVANAALAPGRVRRRREEFLEANVAGTEGLMRAASAAGVRRVVQISTIGVYRVGRVARVDEAAPQKPLDRPIRDWSSLSTSPLYSWTKRVSERVAREQAEALGLELVVLRPGPIYGSGDPKLTAWLARRAARWTLAPSALLPLVHAGDVAAVAVQAVDTGAGAYNVCGPSVSIAELLHAWRAVSEPAGGRVLRVPVPIAVEVDSTRAARDLGFRSRPLAEGIREALSAPLQ